MRAASLRLFAIGLAFILAACGGQVRWHKADSDDASLGNDLAGCSAAARSASQRMYGPPQISSGHGPLGATSTEPSLADRQLREQEAVGRCMREKGYTLVPVER